MATKTKIVKRLIQKDTDFKNVIGMSEANPKSSSKSDQYNLAARQPVQKQKQTQQQKKQKQTHGDEARNSHTKSSQERTKRILEAERVNAAQNKVTKAQEVFPLQQAVVLAEIIGKPRCKSRYSRRARREYGN